MSTAKFNTWLNSDGTENYKCRAWVNFNGTGTVAIRAAGNVSSITDLGTGVYGINFATAMPDVNFSAVNSGGSNSTTVTTTYENAFSGRNTSAITIANVNSITGTAFDADTMNIAVFR